MGEITDRFLEMLDNRLPEALKKISEEQVQDIKDQMAGHVKNRTGALMAGVGGEVVKDGIDFYSSRAGDDPKVPTYLNFGTKNKDGSQRISPRPYMEDSQIHLDERVGRILKDEL